MGMILGYIHTSIYYCCKSFPVLLHDVMVGEWIASCRRPGAGAHRDIERGKVPSAARLACIARSACTSLDQNSNK